MKFTTAAGALMLANAAFASPLAALAAARGVSTRRTGLNIPKPGTEVVGGVEAQASENWGGAVIISTGVTEVTGTFTVPTPHTPPNGNPNTQYCGAAWVGIDGDTCQSGLIQTGIFWCVQNGNTLYEAWYEYIPAASIAYSGISISAGNVINVTVTKTGPHAGTTTLINTSNGQSGTHTFSHDNSGTLCGENAEWIVEDFEEGDSLVPFANFTTVVFNDATAIVHGQTVTAGAHPRTLYIDQGSGPLTHTGVSGTRVTVNYV